MNTNESAKPVIYKVGIGRQLVLWIMLLFFLPFFMSMPIMIFLRITHAKYYDAMSLGVVFLLSFIGVTFIILQILAAQRQRITFSDDKVTFKLPTWRGPNPFGPVIKAELPYSDIASVEKRGEIYAAMGVLGLREVSCCVDKDGNRYVIGYMTEDDPDAPIPFDQVTSELSEKVGKPVDHKGTINAGTQLGAIFYGTPSWETTPINKDDVQTIKKRARMIFNIILAGFVVLAIVGIGLTIYAALA